MLQDETEDLYHLLAEVKAHHPDIEAVSVGAILSNYQRVRVEHVALRPDINLTPLTFLWQRSQSELFAEMLEAGLVSILIKVAGIGLDERDLGKTLRQMQTKLERLSSMYGAHVCGEGGEYETLTIDSPLFKKRIEVGETETVVHSDSSFGSVSYLRLKNARLVEKEDGDTATTARTPPLLDAVGRRTLTAARGTANASSTDTNGLSDHVNRLNISSGSHLDYPPPSIRRKGRYLVLTNITGLSTSTSSSPSVEDQVANAFSTIRRLLSSASSQNLGMEHITHINLYLRSQTLFPLVNSVYRTLFGVSPPTRACVALPSLPAGCDLVINAIAFDDSPSFDRRALHVQGRSFWAPANIGPYSQSLVQAEKIWVAGQIGLRPADLSLPEEGEMQTALSVQHARRIVKATMNDMGGRSVEKGWVEGGICWLDEEGRVEMARRAWTCQAESDDDEEGQTEDWLGQTNNGAAMPSMLFVVLPKASLPRNAAIEWQLTAHTGRIPPPIELTSNDVPSNESEDDDDDNEPGSDATDVRITRLTAIVESFEIVHTITSSSLAKSTFGILTVRRLSSLTTADAQDSDANDALTASLRACAERSYATQLFKPIGKEREEASDVLKRLFATSDAGDSSKLLAGSQLIPCSALHSLTTDSTAQEVDIALVWHGI